MLKVGDTVTIKSNQEIIDCANIVNLKLEVDGVVFKDNMLFYCCNKYTIRKIVHYNRRKYYLLRDGDTPLEDVFTEGMFKKENVSLLEKIICKIKRFFFLSEPQYI
jgi:hypothetical protein